MTARIMLESSLLERTCIMAVASTIDLKKVLIDAYQGFSDKRIKNIEKGQLFVVDDRTDSDKDATGKLFLWFCQIYIEVTDADSIKLILRGGIPINDVVSDWLTKNAAKQANFGLEVTIYRGHQSSLKELAGEWRAMVGPGRRYPEKAYKYVCPRSANSIEKLRSILDTAWGDLVAEPPH